MIENKKTLFPDRNEVCTVPYLDDNQLVNIPKKSLINNNIKKFIIIERNKLYKERSLFIREHSYNINNIDNLAVNKNTILYFLKNNNSVKK